MLAIFTSTEARTSDFCKLLLPTILMPDFQSCLVSVFLRTLTHLTQHFLQFLMKGTPIPQHFAVFRVILYTTFCCICNMAGNTEFLICYTERTQRFGSSICFQRQVKGCGDTHSAVAIRTRSAF